MEDLVVELFGRPESTDHLRRRLERRGFDVVVKEKDQDQVQARYHTEIMCGETEILSLMLGE